MLWQPLWKIYKVKDCLAHSVFAIAAKESVPKPRSFNGQLRGYSTIAGAGANWKSSPLIPSLWDTTRFSPDKRLGTHIAEDIYFSIRDFCQHGECLFVGLTPVLNEREMRKWVFIKWAGKGWGPLFCSIPFYRLVSLSASRGWVHLHRCLFK